MSPESESKFTTSRAYARIIEMIFLDEITTMDPATLREDIRTNPTLSASERTILENMIDVVEPISPHFPDNPGKTQYSQFDIPVLLDWIAVQGDQLAVVDQICSMIESSSDPEQLKELLDTCQTDEAKYHLTTSTIALLQSYIEMAETRRAGDSH